MSKFVNRNMAIALGIVCIVFLAGLAGTIFNYTSIINSKDSQMQILTEQKNQLQTWLDGNTTLLNQEQKWLQGNITYYNSVIWALNAQMSESNLLRL